VWKPSTCNDYVSRLFLVLKPDNNQWRLIRYLRPLNKFCVRQRLKIDTLLGVKHLTGKETTWSVSTCKTGSPQRTETTSLFKLARTTLQIRGATYGVVPIPLLLLQNDTNLREFPASTRPKTAMPGTWQLHKDLLRTNALARREDSPLLRRLSIIRGYKGGSACLTLTSRQSHGQSRHAPPPNQALLDTSSSRPPPRN
jgi:hypothetical protein